MLPLKISKLQVNNFRNLEPQILEFSPGINCIIGENGNGKTNLLEAIHVLITRKSFRKNTSFPQFLGIDGEKPEIIFSSLFEDIENNQFNLSGKIFEKNSEWYLNGKGTKKRLPLGVVFVNPFDSYAFHNVASSRRQWIDYYLGQLDDEYRKKLLRYTKALRFRNSLLSKKPDQYLSQVKAGDFEYANLSYYLTQRRKKFVTELESYLFHVFKELFSEEHDLNMNLDSRVINYSEQQIFAMLQARVEKDKLAGVTTYGVHKDDYLLLFDGLNSYDYCSLGQQKMSYLGLLFAYIELFRYKFKSFPMVLIDDVSGELDSFRWKRLVQYLEKREFQVLITTANEKFEEELVRIRNAKKFKLDSGSITTVQ
jgi:DNA replication and repair protein RecF